MINGKPVVSILGKLLITYSGLLFNTIALKKRDIDKEIKI